MTQPDCEYNRKVFIVNNSGHNYEAAMKWGKLVHVLSGNVNIYHPDRMLFNILTRLKDHKFCNKDYVLLSGNCFSNVLVALAIVNKFRIPVLRMLIYDAHKNEYIVHLLDTKQFKFKKEK